ncbi:sensor domain-containing diguanylate cyclase [Saccharothrix syringae]|uniref:Sensor domain-containing diguanylate cyclase n=1 Tax=Saccharothrix syringae TaxID=103733 RepID=A0A5Q0H6K1_SACSY|nr:sensor domain-containing diguanylate cyclase [Saccharothrix syringae]QFZ21856.1 sensor domain-containing diguanylate cyclase [Saccharothrix syringae]
MNGGFHQAVLERADAAVLVVDPHDLRVRWATPAARRLFGGGHGPLPDLVAPGDAAAVGTFLQAAGRAGASRCGCSVPVEGSTSRRVDLLARDLRDDPEVRGLVVVALDVTGWAETADELGSMLNTDALTGLANRTGFVPRLEQAVRGAPGPVLVFLDIDQFKEVNDRHGHAAGDEVLRLVAGRLASAVAGRGTAARLGGDEFAVLLDRLDERQAVAAAHRILDVIGAPLVPAAGVVRVSVSAGITFVRPGHSAEDLLHQADLAMYRAKTVGPVAVYQEDLEDWALARKHQVDRLAERLEELHAENRALAEAATTDQRTGLPNPASFDAEHHRRNRSGEPYSLLLVDIDRFHSYNTIYRYLAGHETLRQVGQAISRTARTGDRTYRYGGEEFTVLLPGTRLDGALALAERVRRAVERLGLEHRGNPGGVVTVSIGAVEVVPGASVTDAVEEASVAVLEAKDAGRNRVVGRRAVGRGELEVVQ